MQFEHYKLSVFEAEKKNHHSIGLTVLEMDQNHRQSLRNNQVQYYQSMAKINTAKHCISHCLDSSVLPVLLFFLSFFLNSHLF